MSCYCQELNEGKLEDETKDVCSVCTQKLVWEKLSPDEKTKALAYKRILARGKQPSVLMMAFINHLHELYEDFDTGAIP